MSYHSPYGESYFLSPNEIIQLFGEDISRCVSLSVILPISPVPVLITGFEKALSDENVDILFLGVDPLLQEVYPTLRHLRWTVNRKRPLTIFVEERF